MQLRGSNISLACFHGINFKCRSWALFSLQEPCIDFSTESQEIHSTDGMYLWILFMLKFWSFIKLWWTTYFFWYWFSIKGFEDQRVHVVQTLTFGLGVSESELKQRKVPPPVQHRSMATVCRISRNVIFPPQYKTPQEWFHYAFAGSDIDGNLTDHISIKHDLHLLSLWIKEMFSSQMFNTYFLINDFDYGNI